MFHSSPARWLLTLVAVFTLVSPFAADWNATHIYNPHWPPHAKFHNAQTMLLAVVLGLGTLWLVWRRVSTRSAQVLRLQAAALLAAAYWLTQALSNTFPGTGFTDPEFAPVPRIASLPVQLFVDVVALGLVITAYVLERRRLTEAPLA
jgi:hypothetical protein